MIRLSRKTDYALLVLTALARRQSSGEAGLFISVRDLARSYHLPYRFASAVVTDLAHAGILESREGIHGGYRLAKDPAAITLEEILRSTEGDRGVVPCLDAAAHFACVQKTVCTARRGVPAVQRLIREALARHTVADLLAT